MFDINLDDFEAVIFDLDGSLVDSMWMWKAIDIVLHQTTYLEEKKLK